MILVGKKGAALAAFGEIVVLADFKVLFEPSLGDRNEGWKLGESTLRDFFEWLEVFSSNSANSF